MVSKIVISAVLLTAIIVALLGVVHSQEKNTAAWQFPNHSLRLLRQKCTQGLRNSKKHLVRAVESQRATTPPILPQTSTPVAKCQKDSVCIRKKECERKLLKNKGGIREILKKIICDDTTTKKGNPFKKVCCRIPKEIYMPTTPKPSLLPKKCGSSSFINKISWEITPPRTVYPWLVVLAYEVEGSSKLQFLCSGTLISDRYVLTSAQCLDNTNIYPSKKLKLLHLGDYDLSSDLDCEMTVLGPDCSAPHLEVGIEEEIIHPEYDSNTLSNDIALIRMNRGIEFTDEIKPICLLPLKSYPELTTDNYRRPMSAGWGLEKESRNNDIVKALPVYFQNSQNCNNSYGLKSMGKKLCAMGDESDQICNSDHGAPLMITINITGPEIYQVGVLSSFGSGGCSAKNSKPDVYTSVSEYFDWIEQSLKD